MTPLGILGDRANQQHSINPADRYRRTRLRLMAAAVSCAVAQLLLPAPPVGLLSLPQPLLERVAQSGGPALLKLVCSQLRDVVGALEAAAGGRRSRLDVRHVAARQVTLVWAVRELRCPLTADTAAAVASSGCVAALQWARDQVGSVQTCCAVLRFTSAMQRQSSVRTYTTCEWRGLVAYLHNT